MEQTQIQLEKELPLLTKAAMEAFCEDINGMLGLEMTCSDPVTEVAPPAALKKQFPKLSAVHYVQSSGGISGTFSLVFDRKGTFVLPGIIVMLPEKRVLDYANIGTLEDTKNLADSIKETGNLLVGSWDRAFREQFRAHKHFLQTGTFIGDLWTNTEENLRIPESLTCLQVTCELAVSGFPPFLCTAVFPEALYKPGEEAAPDTDEPAAATEAAPDATPDATPAEQPAESPTPAEPPAQAAPQAAASADEAAAEPAEEQESAEPTETTAPPSTSDPIEAAGPVRQAIEAMIQSPPPGPLPEAGAQAAVLNVPAESVMDRQVCWCMPEESVENVLHLMQQRNTGYVLIEDEKKLAGILSSSDLNAALSPYLRPAFASHRRPLDEASLQIRVKWFMSRPVRTVPAHAPLRQVLETMTRSRIRALPVVNPQGTVLGIITALDIFSFLLRMDNAPQSESKPLNTEMESDDGKEKNG